MESKPVEVAAEAKAVENFWHVLQVFSGKEQQVVDSIQRRLTEKGLAVKELLIPMRDVIKVSKGNKTVKQEKLYPGYVFVHCQRDELVFFEIGNVYGVIGFPGAEFGEIPPTMTDKEIQDVLAKMEAAPAVALPKFTVGGTVVITAETFNGMVGKVTALDTHKQQLTVTLNFFGRDTEVTLAQSSVQKV